VSGTVTLWRPAGSEELALVEASGWRESPPRLPGKSIFYPVLSEEYAAKIARDWNVPRSGAGYVTGGEKIPAGSGRAQCRSRLVRARS
jgi:hypothetical protein